MAEKPSVEELQAEIHRLKGWLIAHELVLLALLENLGKAVPGAGSFVRSVLDDARQTGRAIGGRARGKPASDVEVTRALEVIQSMAATIQRKDAPRFDAR